MRYLLTGFFLVFCAPALATTIQLTLERISSTGDINNSAFGDFDPQSVVVEYTFDPLTPDLVDDPTDVNAPFIGGYVGTLSTKADFYQGPGGTGTFRGGLEVEPNPVSGVGVFNDAGPTAADGVLFGTPVNQGLTSFVTASGVLSPYQGEEYLITLSASFVALFADDSLANVTQDIFDQPPSNIFQPDGEPRFVFEVAPVGNFGRYEIEYQYTPTGLSGVPLPMPLMLFLSGLIGLRLARKAQI